MRLTFAALTTVGLLLAGDADAGPRRCTTTWRRHYSVRLPGARPASAVSVSSAAGFGFKVHGPAGSDALLARIRSAADQAWQAEIVQAGWPAPPADTGGPDSAYDFYVDPTQAQGEAYTQPEDTVTTVAWDAMTSFIGLPDSYADDAELFSIVAHELSHGSQFGIDASEDDAFYEHTSVFMEKVIAHDVPTYAVGVQDYQAHPDRALNYFGSDLYEYGAGMWLIFLSERYDAGGQALVKRLWLESKQSVAANEPDFLDVLPAIAADKGTDLKRFFATYAAWRYFTGARNDGLHFADAAAWGPSSLVVADVLTPSPAGSFQVWIAPFGAAWRVVSVPAGAVALDVTVTGADGVASATALDSAGKASGDLVFALNGEPAQRLALPAGTAHALVAVSYAPPAWDPDTKNWSTHQVETRVEAVYPQVTPDAGPVADEPDAGVGVVPAPDPKPVCHCATAGSAPVWLLGLGTLGWLGRRRGAYRRMSPILPAR